MLVFESPQSDRPVGTLFIPRASRLLRPDSVPLIGITGLQALPHTLVNDAFRAAPSKGFDLPSIAVKFCVALCLNHVILLTLL